jgi:hypothetical protein
VFAAPRAFDVNRFHFVLSFIPVANMFILFWLASQTDASVKEAITELQKELAEQG